MGCLGVGTEGLCNYRTAHYGAPSPWKSQEMETAMASRLRHIAIIVPDPEQAAKFFESAFGMTRAGTARRGIYMSDGVMNVALLKTEGNEKPGLYHFGMWVDDLDEAEKKVTDAGGY